MAVAVAGGKQFGSGESSITARMPLMVRASAPRFLNFGDAFEFPVVVQNQTDEAMSVDVTLRASNARLSGMAGSSSGRRVTVPANDRVEVRIPLQRQQPEQRGSRLLLSLVVGPTQPKCPYRFGLRQQPKLLRPTAKLIKAQSANR